LLRSNFETLSGTHLHRSTGGEGTRETRVRRESKGSGGEPDSRRSISRRGHGKSRTNPVRSGPSARRSFSPDPWRVSSIDCVRRRAPAGSRCGRLCGRAGAVDATRPHERRGRGIATRRRTVAGATRWHRRTGQVAAPPAQGIRGVGGVRARRDSLRDAPRNRPTDRPTGLLPPRPGRVAPPTRRPRPPPMPSRHVSVRRGPRAHA
jgi:hypothetical protein